MSKIANMKTTARNIELTPLKFGEIIFEESEMNYLRGISNSDVLPDFGIKGSALVVTIHNHDGEKISNRKGFGWVHTNFQCPAAQKQRAKLAEANRKLEEIRMKRNNHIVQSNAQAKPGDFTLGATPFDEEYTKAERAARLAQKKLCNKDNARYGCSHPCGKCLDLSKDGAVVKINGSISFRNGYGASDIDFVYFVVIKNVDGIPKLYVRRRPANSNFLAMSAQEYQKEYVAKNKHIKNSFCICNFQQPQMLPTERNIEVTDTPEPATPEVQAAGSINLPAVIDRNVYLTVPTL